MPGRRIAFRALGTLDLRRPDGQRIDALLSQPRRMALLAYLAAATPRGLHSRDRLATLFSPEADQQRARQALRQALSVLRGELGSETIVTVGDDEVGLDFSAVWCDVVAFDDAVAAGQYDKALELYRGGFLEAFYIRNAAGEFEQWIDTVRARLKEGVSTCARSLVDRYRTSGDLAAATVWARRARELVPEDEVMLRDLIELLDLAGNRAGALQAYEEFAEWLKRVYETDPAPETRALIEDVRRRIAAVPPSPPAPAPSRTEQPIQPESVKPPEPIDHQGPPPPSPSPPWPSLVALAGGVLVVAAGLLFRYGAWWRDRPSCVQIDRFNVEDTTSRPWLGDSLAHRVAEQLTGFPDFVSRSPDTRCPWRSGVVRHVTGTVRWDRGQVAVEARLGVEPSVVALGTVQAWTTLGESLASQLLWQIYRSPLDSSLPAAVLPRTPQGRSAFLEAEKLFAEGRWTEAAKRYKEAETVDATCYLCSWRRAELGRWAREERERTRSYLDHIDLFPAHYQGLIRAMQSPLRDRFDRLSAVTRKWPYFWLGWFERGDELFHTGSLVGHARQEAIAVLWEAVKLRPDFAPAWEHLAWARALDGDSAGASVALDSLRQLRRPHDPYSVAIHGLVEAGFAWRFASPAQADGVTKKALSPPELWEFEALASGPRYLPTFGSPRGAVEVGRLFLELAQERTRPDFATSALVARVFGYVALGQTDSARRAARDLAAHKLTPELDLFVHELEAALLVLDATPDGLKGRWPELAKDLSQFAEARTASDGVHGRAAWSYVFAARRAGDPTDRYAAVLDREPLLRRLAIADAHARAGRWKNALDASDPLVELQADALATPEPAAPFFRGILHLLRAEWHLKLGNLQDARAELLWYQNLDEERGWLTQDPQAAEADWALATLAQWRLARMLDLAGEQHDTACRAYGEVVRLWSGGEPAYKARADTARARQAALGCVASP